MISDAERRLALFVFQCDGTKLYRAMISDAERRLAQPSEERHGPESIVCNDL